MRGCAALFELASSKVKRGRSVVTLGVTHDQLAQLAQLVELRTRIPGVVARGFKSHVGLRFSSSIYFNADGSFVRFKPRAIYLWLRPVSEGVGSRSRSAQQLEIGSQKT